MEEIFKSLLESVSEDCFNEICGLVEDLINETDPNTPYGNEVNIARGKRKQAQKLLKKIKSLHNDASQKADELNGRANAAFNGYIGASDLSRKIENETGKPEVYYYMMGKRGEKEYKNLKNKLENARDVRSALADLSHKYTRKVSDLNKETEKVAQKNREAQNK